MTAPSHGPFTPVEAFLYAREIELGLISVDDLNQYDPPPQIDQGYFLQGSNEPPPDGEFYYAFQDGVVAFPGTPHQAPVSTTVSPSNSETQYADYNISSSTETFTATVDHLSHQDEVNNTLPGSNSSFFKRSLFEFPTEVRLVIYRWVLGFPRSVRVRRFIHPYTGKYHQGSSFLGHLFDNQYFLEPPGIEKYGESEEPLSINKQLGLIFTCHQIRNESEPLFFSKNSFETRSMKDLSVWVQSLQEAQVGAIRRLTLSMGPWLNLKEGASEEAGWAYFQKPGSKSTRFKLHNLQEVTVVKQGFQRFYNVQPHPLFFFGYYDESNVEKKLLESGFIKTDVVSFRYVYGNCKVVQYLKA
jgi:hypothetical protein